MESTQSASRAPRAVRVEGAEKGKPLGRKRLAEIASLATQTAITLATGASIKGRLPAQPAVTLNSSAVVET